MWSDLLQEALGWPGAADAGVVCVVVEGCVEVPRGAAIMQCNPEPSCLTAAAGQTLNTGGLHR